MSFSIQIIGSNSSLPAYGRHHTSQFVNVGNQYFLIDCGEGTQYQLQQYKAKVSRVNHIFISHLHGDHFLGLMGVVFSMHLSGRTKDLHVYGQKGLDEIIITQLKWSSSALNYSIKFHLLKPDKPNVIFENKAVSITSFPLKHKIACCGFLIREKRKPRRINTRNIPENFPLDYFKALKSGRDILDSDGKVLFKNTDLTLAPRRSRSYAFCSDTAFMESLAEVVKGVDVLYHEATFLEEKREWAGKTLHSTTHDAARIAKEAKVGKLLIGHYSARYKDVSPFVAECRTIFDETIPAIEGEIIQIEE